MSELIPLDTVLAHERARRGAEIDEICAWARRGGRPVDPDVLALVLCVVAEWRPPRWTRAAVYELIRVQVPNWCGRHRCAWPGSVPATVWQWLHHRDATGRRSPDDESLHDLLKPLLCWGALGFDGRPARPAARRSSTANASSPGERDVSRR